MKLRVATDDDVDVLLPMMDDFNAGEGISVDREPLERAVRTLLGDPALGRIFLVHVGPAQEGDASACAAVGYAVITLGFDLEFAGPDAFLTELYLQPEARCRGLGQKAMAALEEEAAALGAGALHLMVRHENAAALALYRRRGFESPARLFLTKRLASRPSFG